MKFAFCPYCGYKLNDEFAFCPKCGKRLPIDGESDETVLSIVLDVLEKICAYDGPVFGASEIECGNYRELELKRGKEECAKYLEVLKSKVNDFKYRT